MAASTQWLARGTHMAILPATYLGHSSFVCEGENVNRAIRTQKFALECPEEFGFTTQMHPWSADLIAVRIRTMTDPWSSQKCSPRARDGSMKAKKKNRI